MTKSGYIIVIFLFFTFFFTTDLTGQKKNSKNRFRFKYLYSEALKNKMHENYIVAINYFEDCLKIIPNSSASAYQLSVLHLKLKELEKAKYYINYALKFKEKNEWYILQKSLVASALGDQKLYKSCYKSLNRYYPDKPVYAYEMAILYFKDGEYALSIAILDKIEEKLGILENISFLKNNVYFETKKYKLIENELNKLVNVYPDSVKYIDMLGEYFLSMQHINKSLSLYKNGLQYFPGNKKLNIKIGKIYASLKEYKIGYNYLIKGIGSEYLSVERQFEIAGLYLSSVEIEKNQKIKIYEKFIELNFSVEEIENSFINFLLNEKELSLAEQKIKDIFEKNIQNFELWNSLFSIYISQNRVEELNTYAEDAKNYFPNQAIIYFYSGYSFFLLKKYKDASNSLITGLDYVIENESLEKDFYLYLAESFHAQNLHKKSDLYFDKYLALDSSNAYLLNNYAYYLSQRNKEIEKAHALSRKSIEIEPFNSSFLDTYAWIYYLKSDYKNALFNIEKAYKYGGKNNPVICEHYGDILLKNEMKDDALKKWKESLKLNPKNTSVTEKIQSLN